MKRQQNALPIGKEIFLSTFYCYSGEHMRVIRTKDGLQFMTSPYHTREYFGFEDLMDHSIDKSN